MQADEEMLLLEGIDSYGLGNWSAVSKNVGSKTAAECRDHYFEIYVRQDLVSTFLLQHLRHRLLKCLKTLFVCIALEDEFHVVFM